MIHEVSGNILLSKAVAHGIAQTTTSITFRNEDVEDTPRRRLEVRARLPAACLAERISTDSLLRLDGFLEIGFQFPDDAGLSSLAGVAVARLDVLAGKRHRAATGTTQVMRSLQRLLRPAERDHDRGC